MSVTKHFAMMNETNADQADKTFEVVDDLDELEPRHIENMLVKTAVIKEKPKERKDWRVPAEIECNNSIYLFNRESLFRRAIYHVQ